MRGGRGLSRTIARFHAPVIAQAAKATMPGPASIAAEYTVVLLRQPAVMGLDDPRAAA